MNCTFQPSNPGLPPFRSLYTIMNPKIVLRICARYQAVAQCAISVFLSSINGGPELGTPIVVTVNTGCKLIISSQPTRKSHHNWEILDYSIQPPSLRERMFLDFLCNSHNRSDTRPDTIEDSKPRLFEVICLLATAIHR